MNQAYGAVTGFWTVLQEKGDKWQNFLVWSMIGMQQGSQFITHIQQNEFWGSWDWS